jgi:hypothetical protein
LQLIAFLESLHASGGIQHAPLTGEKGVALTAYLNFKLLPGRTCGKLVATGADYLSVGIILRVYLLFHDIQPA